MESLDYLTSNFNLFRLKDTSKTREWTVSPYHGIHLFEGQQGSGKTLTLIRFIKSMVKDFPNIKVLSNVSIGDIDFIEWNTTSDLIRLIRYENIRGCIVVIDEGNVVFPSTDKPTKDFLEIVCMLRHFEIYLCMTCQVASRMAKYIREQTKYITSCKCPIKGLSVNKTYTIDYDKMLMAEDSGQIQQALKLVDTQIYFHSIKDYQCYDSHATIKLLEVNNNDC